MSEWVLLAYRLPREPSTPRISVWRQLRRMGAIQLSDGLVAVPLDARTREHMDWLAGEVVEHGGEATVWLGRPGTAAQERSVIDRMKRAVAAEYEAILADASAAAASVSPTRRTLARLRRELRRTGLRDYFPGQARRRADAAVERLARRIEEAS